MLFATAGSIVGREHVRLHRNNQDGVALCQTPIATAAVVTDGCSSGRYAEVGARLGAAWLATSLPELARAGADGLADRATDGLLAYLETIGRGLCGGDQPRSAVVQDYLLFGFLAAVITPERALVFGMGDGVVSVNGQVTAIDPGEGNAPRYPGYRLVPATARRFADAALFPVVYHDGPADEIRTLLVATDGALPLVPGVLAELENDDRLEKNPSLLHKRLVVLGNRPGGMHDDTTIALVKRREVSLA